jgi:hypothetical protein
LRASLDANLLLAAAFHWLGDSGPAPEQQGSGGHGCGVNDLVSDASQVD